jgi:hypothetical protein
MAAALVVMAVMVNGLLAIRRLCPRLDSNTLNSEDLPASVK